MKKTTCCDGSCRQGRGCPLNIPTNRSPLRRAAESFGQALEDHWWLPIAIAGILLLIVNFPT